jgi:hypothetical protein
MTSNQYIYLSYCLKVEHVQFLKMHLLQEFDPLSFYTLALLSSQGRVIFLFLAIKSAY